MEEIPDGNITPELAARLLRSYGANQSGDEPPLSVLCAMLLYRGGAEGIPSDKDAKDGLLVWHKRFFTMARIQRLLRGVRDGEVGDDIADVLQQHLNRTGGSPIVGIPFWRHYSGWFKRRILNCFEPAAFQALRESKGWTRCCHLSTPIPLQELLTLPLRDLYGEFTVENN